MACDTNPRPCDGAAQPSIIYVEKPSITPIPGLRERASLLNSATQCWRHRKPWRPASTNELTALEAEWDSSRPDVFLPQSARQTQQHERSCREVMWMIAVPEVVGRAMWAKWPGRPVSHIQSDVDGGRKWCFKSPSNRCGSINEAFTFIWFPKLGKKQHVLRIPEEMDLTSSLKIKRGCFFSKHAIFYTEKLCSDPTRTLMNECETLKMMRKCDEWNSDKKKTHRGLSSKLE